VTYTEFAEKLLVILYQESEIGRESDHSFGELIAKYGLERNERWLERLPDEWAADGLAEVHTSIGSPLAWSAEITGRGMRHVERNYGGKDGVGTVIEPVALRNTAHVGARPLRYKDFSNQFLVAAYHESRSRPNETIRSGEIIDRYPLTFEPGWVVQLVRDLGVRGYFTSTGVDSDDRGQPIRLTGRGLRVAEDLIEAGLDIRVGVLPETSTLEGLDTIDPGALDDIFRSRDREAPASDRIVALDHNSPDLVKAISDAKQLAVQLQESNDVGNMSPEAVAVAADEIGQIAISLERPAVRMPSFGNRAVSTLTWIGKEAAGALIGAAALGLLALLATILGIPL
jgi:hypothetical protein